MGEEFKLPGSSYEELIKIIKTYAQAKDYSLDELSKLCGIPTTQISRNSGFLVATNIVSNGKQKEVTEKGKELGRAFLHNINDEISRIWKEIVIETDFLSKMVTAVKIRNGMDIQSFQSHIAYSSGQNSNSYVKTGANTIIEIMKITNLIEEVDGKLIYKEIDNPIKTQPINNPISYEPELKAGNNDTPLKEIIHSKSGISINIDIKIIAKVNEIDDLGIKLKKLIKDIDATEE